MMVKHLTSNGSNCLEMINAAGYVQNCDRIKIPHTRVEHT